MERRKIILLVAFGLVIAYGLIDRVVYPRWIEPLVTIDRRIALKQQEHERLKAKEVQVAAARQRYKAVLARTGSFEIGEVETDVRDRINQLIERHSLSEAKVSPGRTTEDRKSGLARKLVSVSASAKLGSCIQFLRDLAELPQSVRVGNVSIYPVSSGRSGRGPDLMNLRVPVEFQVPPSETTAGVFALSEEGERPGSFRRHQNRDYALIWKGKPFSEYVPLQASAGPDLHEQVGRRVMLRGSATGGDGPYTFEWTPSEGLDHPTRQTVTVDSSSPFQRTYSLQVTDSRGKTATANVRVTVVEPPKPREPAVAATPPPQPGDRRWPDGRFKQLRMTLLASTGVERHDEIMVYDNRHNQGEYYTLGADFDGGELVLVHPTGGLVRRSGAYFIYPIGGFLDEDLPADSQAQEMFPELVRAAEWLRNEVDEPDQQTDAASDVGDGKSLPAPEKRAPDGGPAAQKARDGDSSSDAAKRKQAAQEPPERRTVGRESVGPLPDEVRFRVQRFRDGTRPRRPDPKKP